MSSFIFFNHTDRDPSFNGKPLNIQVGEVREPFFVHEPLIRASSAFFDKAMAKEWIESKQHTIVLPEDSPKIFALYVHWIYTGKMPVGRDEPGQKSTLEYMELVDSYVLGDKILDTNFQNSVMDAIIEKSCIEANDGYLWYPNASVIKHAYEKTTSSASIRKLLVDMYVKGGISEWLNSTTCPKEFLFSVASELLRNKKTADEPLNSIEYHVHNWDGSIDQSLS